MRRTAPPPLPSTPKGHAMDYDEAVDKLARTGMFTNDGQARAAVARIQAEALIDIARSLSVISLEASFAMQRAGVIEVNLEDGMISAPAEPEPDFLVVGDIVAVRGTDEIGEVVKLGIDQGEIYANVEFVDRRGLGGQRFYKRNLERVPADATQRLIDAVMSETTTIELETDEPDDEGGEPTPRAEINGAPADFEPSDDIDADFEPEAALEKLSKGKKGGKK